jgi:hypothetical protein
MAAFAAKFAISEKFSPRLSALDPFVYALVLASDWIKNALA